MIIIIVIRQKYTKIYVYLVKLVFTHRSVI